MRKGSIQHYAAVIDQIPDSTAGQASDRPIQRSAMTHSQNSDVSSPQLPNRSQPAPSPNNRSNNRSSTHPKSERRKTRRPSRTPENSEVLVSAVISTYLLTHLHHVLQRAEYGAVQDGRRSQAANYAQLRKVLCMDARSMKDASASGLKATELDQAA